VRTILRAAETAGGCHPDEDHNSRQWHHNKYARHYRDDDKLHWAEAEHGNLSIDAG
jgi:hypothetical protein